MVSISFLLVELKLSKEWIVTPSSLAALASGVYLGMALGAYCESIVAPPFYLRLNVCMPTTQVLAIVPIDLDVG